jgi:hypothetical protein
MTFGVTMCSNYQKQVAQNEFIQKQNAQNVAAMEDSLTVMFDKKLKAYVWDKQNFMVNKLEDLEKYNKDLADQLKKVKGDVIAAIDSKIKIELPDVAASNQLVTVDKDQNLYGLNFDKNYKDPGFEQNITGQSRFRASLDDITKKWVLTPDSTLFTKNTTTIGITYGFRNLKDKYEVFAISPSPMVKLTDLNGVFVLDKEPPQMPKKDKNFGFGPYIGFGMNTDPNLTNARFGWSFGVSVHYNIWSWRWGKK